MTEEKSRAEMRRIAVATPLVAEARWWQEKCRADRLELQVRSLFDKIKHGDQAHQDWLEAAIKEHFPETFK